MSEVKSGVVKLSVLMEGKGGKGIFENDFNLEIPHYQRPYVWEIAQVRILLEDIQESLSQDGGYLLGSLILCQSQNGENCFDIVDGQQRLTTLALILRALEVSGDFLSDAKFEHNHSKYHIKDNYEFIQEWIREIPENLRDKIRTEIQEIEFIYVLAPSLDDAFIFFDSANSRGKKLREYDLMKAFHLRVLENDSKKLVPYYAKRFEELAKKKNKDSLQVFFREIIAPLRAWIRKEKINAGKIKLYDEFCKEENKRDEIASHRDLGVVRGIVGGEDFFIYLDRYMQIFEIAKSDKLYQSLFDLKDSWHYTCYLYAMALILYFDKFEKKSDEMIRLIARVVLVLRFEQDRIGRPAIRDRAIKFLPKIFFTQTHSELKRFLENEKANKGTIEEDWKKPKGWWRKESKKFLEAYDKSWESVFQSQNNQNHQNQTKGE